jgi:hypothetical protein
LFRESEITGLQT